MTEQTPPTIKGWHPDPENPSLQRFWDGKQFIGKPRQPFVNVELRASQLIPILVISNLITAGILFVVISIMNAA